MTFLPHTTTPVSYVYPAVTSDAEFAKLVEWLGALIDGVTVKA